MPKMLCQPTLAYIYGVITYTVSAIPLGLRRLSGSWDFFGIGFSVLVAISDPVPTDGLAFGHSRLGWLH
jgi:hypothetical protein